jgi:hypothetical protein
MAFLIGNYAHQIIQDDYMKRHPGVSEKEYPMPDGSGRRADIVNLAENISMAQKGVYEIKPVEQSEEAVAKCDVYVRILNDAKHLGGNWVPGTLYYSSWTPVFLGPYLELWAWQAIAGAILYEAREPNGIRVPFAKLKELEDEEKKLKQYYDALEKAMKKFFETHPVGQGSFDVPDILPKIVFILIIVAGVTVAPFLLQQIITALSAPEPGKALAALGLASAAVAALLALSKGTPPAG